MVKSLPRRIRAVAITGGKNVPSRRYRIAALLPFLEGRDIEVTELCPRINRFPPSSRLLRLPWILCALIERLFLLGRVRGYDAVILQRELISTLPTLERMLPRPLILDVDDAIYLHRNGWAAKRIAKLCAVVVCGNRTLAKKFSQWCENVIVIPTGVDTKLLRPVEESSAQREKPVIGWIGTSGNYPHLQMIKPALKQILDRFPSARLQVIADQFPECLSSLGEQLVFERWREGIENELVPLFTLGLMPLADNEWTRGKCAFKMLQYMAAGVPVVVSPVGVNQEILAAAAVGRAACNTDEWVESIAFFLENPVCALEMGRNGRDLVEREYSLDSVANAWSNALNNLL